MLKQLLIARIQRRIEPPQNSQRRFPIQFQQNIAVALSHAQRFSDRATPLSDERVEKPEDAVKIGQVLPFKILKLDQGQKKIGLSARAVGKENDPEDVRTYQETGSGMATLGDIGDIANLFGAASDKKREE